MGVASLAGLIFVGFYDLSVEVQTGIHATYLRENCGCEMGDEVNIMTVDHQVWLGSIERLSKIFSVPKRVYFFVR